VLFPTLNFGLFFLALFAVAWSLAGRPVLRKAVLVAASYAFYAAWDWRFMALLLASTALNWGGGQLVASPALTAARRQQALALTVALDLGLLGIFKYFNFFMESLGLLLAPLGLGRDLPFLAVVLPVGISFFTFHGISYVVDLSRGDLRRPAGFLDMLLYISFFPQLVAGPIVRAAHFLPQLERPVDPDRIAATRAFLLIAGGLFKKVVVANYLATEIVDEAFRDPTRLGALDLLIGIYAYAFQIYCDFSAYTDIAIGLAALLGYRFPQNFDQPYRAESVRAFWRRWHISLSTWLRDYLYIPLGGSAEGWMRYRNLLVTMLLGGLWHGANWTFVAWGALHGLWLAAEHLLVRREPRGWARAAAIVVTFHFVCLTWIFFRAPDFGRALDYLAGFGRITQPAMLTTPLILTLLALMAIVQFLPRDRVERAEGIAIRLPLAVQGVLLGLAIVLIDAMGPEGVAPFIYFQF
jgi:D-alanyl-lipoteichoic acid acyltransferase DltB (MBOAT superfamily)